MLIVACRGCVADASGADNAISITAATSVAIPLTPGITIALIPSSGPYNRWLLPRNPDSTEVKTTFPWGTHPS